MKRNSIFNSIPLLRPKRNTFNLSYENKLTTDLFRLTPIMCKEALPDDVVKIRPEIFCRVSPLLSPIFHRLNIRTYYFFVPTRIIWKDFEEWINPKSGTTEIVPPKIYFPNDGDYSGNLALTSVAVAPKSLADYLGLNFGVSPSDASTTADFSTAVSTLFPEGFTVSSLPFRAYQQIYNDWFIDLNNVDVAEFSKDSGVETFYVDQVDMNQNALYTSLLKMRYRAWEHDYFTSALPEPQRGPDVNAFDGGEGSVTPGGDVSGFSISGSGVVAGQIVSTDAPEVVESEKFVYAKGTPNEQSFNLYNYVLSHKASFDGLSTASTVLTAMNTGRLRPGFSSDNGTTPVAGIYYTNTNNTTTFVPLASDYTYETVQVDGLPADGFSHGSVTMTGADIASKLSIVSNNRTRAEGDEETVTIPAVTVEELRIRMQMQSFLERNEIGGSRYTEMLYAHWGVKDPDGRLQRSEFIGGCKQPIVISDITSTVNADDEPLGMYAGHAESSSSGKTIKYRVPEHGYIIGLTCIVPRSGYSQGIHPMWTRFDRLDYYWPSFAHLGEQEVKNKEIMFTGIEPDATFGYQQRYAEYKSSVDEVHGDMKGSLSHWHMGRMFATPTDADDLPKLSEFFTTPQDSDSDDLSRVWPVANSAFEVQNADHFVLDIYQHFIASRRMPKFVTPRNGQ